MAKYTTTFHSSPDSSTLSMMDRGQPFVFASKYGSLDAQVYVKTSGSEYKSLYTGSTYNAREGDIFIPIKITQIVVGQR
jgi:hypothetical protein